MKKRTHKAHPGNSFLVLGWNYSSVLGLATVLAALILVDLSVVAAQPAGIMPGDRVRVSAENIPYDTATGTVVDLYSDHLRLAMGAQHWDIPWNELYSLDVRREKRMTLQGALIGAGAGAALGGIIGLATYKECNSEELFGCFLSPESRGQSAAVGAFLGAIPGGVIGLIAGASTKKYSWERVQLGVSFNNYRSAHNFAGLSPGVNIRIRLGKNTNN